MSTGLEIPDFLTHLLNVYQEKPLGEANEAASPSNCLRKKKKKLLRLPFRTFWIVVVLI